MLTNKALSVKRCIVPCPKSVRKRTARTTHPHHLADLQFINLHEDLVEYFLLEAEQEDTIERRVCDDPSSVKGTSLVLAGAGCQGVDPVIGDVADLW